MVVRQHGGTIELVDNQPGLKVILRLPAERVVADVLRSQEKYDALAPATASPRKITAAGT